jgi:hypothetical protein
MANGARADHTEVVASARPARSSRPHLIVVETPRAAAVDTLVERAARLAECTVERKRDGSASLALAYREPAAKGLRQTSRLSGILSTVEHWLRQQPVTGVTVWVDGRRFSLTRRDAYGRPAAADQALGREQAARKRTTQTAARTASS